MREWPARRWLVAVAVATATVVAIGIPTVLIDNPIFTREIPPTWWSWPALLVTSALVGLIAATYVRPSAVDAPGGSARGATEPTDVDADRTVRSRTTVGGLLSFFAVGCPVCNKLVLVALGYSGAMNWFAPVQPVLAVGGIIVLGVALRRRLAGEQSCPVDLEQAPELVG